MRHFLPRSRAPFTPVILCLAVAVLSARYIGADAPSDGGPRQRVPPNQAQVAPPPAGTPVPGRASFFAPQSADCPKPR